MSTIRSFVNLLSLFRVSGCVDHFAWEEKEAFDYTRNIISTLNFQLPEEEEDSAMRRAMEEPLHRSVELLGLAPLSYSDSLDVKMVKNASKLFVLWIVQFAVFMLSPYIYLKKKI